MSNEVKSEEQIEIFNAITKQNKNLFIQGQAGTGKSTLINWVRHDSEKNVVVACPTAIAAMNVGGCTLHSLFRFKPKNFLDPNTILNKREKGNDIVLKHIQILIIDEISMVRPDLLDCIDVVLKEVKKSKKPFGGIQVVLVGDLLQLPPIVTSDVKEIFYDFYGSKSPYFFDSRAYKEGGFETRELKTVHRQDDSRLLENLRNIRNGENLKSTLDFFNSIPHGHGEGFENATVLTPYREKADKINELRLSKLTGEEYIYDAEIEGTFKNQKDTPAPEQLKLKEGAFVIFTRNDKDKRWINGNTGTVTECNSCYIVVKLTTSGEEVFVLKDSWELVKYNYDKVKKKITEETVGTFKQYPLQLGYATTIHKSQSKTLDKVILDIDRGIFAPGQLYVALSRTRKAVDMLISKELKEKDIIIDKRVEHFLKWCLNNN